MMEYSTARKSTASHSPNAERKEPDTKWPSVSLHVRDGQKDVRPGCAAGSQGGGYIGEELGKVTGMDMVGGGAQSPELGGGFASVFLGRCGFWLRISLTKVGKKAGTFYRSCPWAKLLSVPPSHTLGLMGLRFINAIHVINYPSSSSLTSRGLRDSPPCGRAGAGHTSHVPE